MCTFRIVHTPTGMDAQAHPLTHTHGRQPDSTSLTVTQHFLVESEHGARPGGTDHGQQQQHQQQAQPTRPRHGGPGPFPQDLWAGKGTSIRELVQNGSTWGGLNPIPTWRSQTMSGDPSPAHDPPPLHISFCISALRRIPIPACFFSNHSGIWSGHGPKAQRRHGLA